MRVVSWLAVLTLAVVTAAAGCDDDFDATPDGSGAGGSGGGLGEEGAISGLALINPACGVGSGGTVSQACIDCTTDHCASEMTDCFGAGWQSDLQAGVCTDFGSCVSACDCGDNACFKVCLQQLDSNPTDPCRACVVDLVACEKAHCDVECEMSTDPGKGGSGSGAGSGGG